MEKRDALQILHETLDVSMDDTDAHLRCWRAIQGFSLAQVREALDGVGEIRIPSSGMLVHQMLFFRWGQLDPVSAMAAGWDQPPSLRDGAFVGVMTAWVKMDPEAIAAWAANEPKMTSRKGIAASIAPGLLNDDPRNALARAAAMGPDMVAEVINALARSEGADPDQRQAFLKLLADRGNPAELAAGREAILKRWAALDPAAAMEGAEHMDTGMSDGANTRETVFKQWARDNPGKALQWVEGHPDAVSMEGKFSAYERWLSKAPADAEQWLDASAATPDFYAAMTPRILSNAIRDESIPKWAGPRSGESNIKALQIHYARWKAVQPEAANAWLKTINPDVRSKMEEAAR